MEMGLLLPVMFPLRLKIPRKLLGQTVRCALDEPIPRRVFSIKPPAHNARFFDKLVEAT